MKILITGSNGQLGSELKFLTKDVTDYDYRFKNHKELDLTDEILLTNYLRTHRFDYIINCAAYTAVEQAETNQADAFLVNAKVPELLANLSHELGTVLIHISTDFVFDGGQKLPYKEDDKTRPLSIYGKSKLEGEQKITSSCERYFILRTSWMYSPFGHNFIKTMLSLAKTKKELSVVSDQIGCPTNARDLAQLILDMINSGNTKYGVYHFSNTGEISWYDFAKKIFELKNISIQLNAVTTKEYGKSNVDRPMYSVLDSSKIHSVINTKIKPWASSLQSSINEF